MLGEKAVLRYPAPTIEQMRKHLFSYRDNMRVEVEQGISVTAKTVADLRALSTWPEGLVLNIHVEERRNGGAGILIQHARPPLPAAVVCRKNARMYFTFRNRSGQALL